MLTFDYEIFGNGTGDITGCLVNPTRNILQLLKKYDARATFFVDVCLIWALRDNADSDAFRSQVIHPLTLIEDQLATILSEGHDIQLHAHPQLFKTKHNGCRFDVNTDYWRITDLPYAQNHGGPVLSKLISKGKATLTDLCQKTLPEHQVVAFRAGGLCSRPEGLLLRALRENNIYFDFSASYNYKCDFWPENVDFTDVLSSPDPMPVGESYRDQRQASDLVLFPIYGAIYHYFTSELMKRFWRKVKRDKSRWSWKKKRPEGANGDTSIPGIPPRTYSKPSMLSRVKPYTINYYIENSVHDMIWCAKDAVRRAKRSKKDIYMVGIGHPKAMGDLSQLELFFQWIRDHRERDMFQFTIVRDLLEHQLVETR